MTSFNPVQRIGHQVGEVARHHEGAGRKAAMGKAIQRLSDVRISDAARRSHQYPHEFSGGERQRAMIAMGLMGSPQLIIADEPTTALDVTVQRQVLRLLDDVRRDRHASILFISHDITVVEQLCSRVLVMYAGRIVEEIPAADLHRSAQHPYTRALLGAVPDMETSKGSSLTVIPGRPPEPDALPSGCAFAPRCSFATEECSSADPELAPVGAAHRVACWHPQRSASLDVAALVEFHTGSPSTGVSP
jgi:oligopeptide/dipeptide ABC transporter ATP-binding protein